MNVLQQLIEIRGFVEGVDDFEDDLTLGFDPLQVGHVEKAEHDSRAAGSGPTSRLGIKPTPLPVLRAQAITAAGCTIGQGAKLAEHPAKGCGVIFVDKI